MTEINPYNFIADEMKRNRREDPQATFLAVLLEEAERLFGPRVEPYPCMFAGLNYDAPSPRIGFRNGGGKRKYVIIRLSRKSRDDRQESLWELTHECVHLLAPSKKAKIPVLEEGMAVWYQSRWVSKCPAAFPETARTEDLGYGAPFDKPYLDAFALVQRLLSRDERIVAKIREVEPWINKISAELILQKAPWVNEETAKKLVTKFSKEKSKYSWMRATRIYAEMQAKGTRR
jgi:hypothetical protein